MGVPLDEVPGVDSLLPLLSLVDGDVIPAKGPLRRSNSHVANNFRLSFFRNGDAGRRRVVTHVAIQKEPPKLEGVTAQIVEEAKESAHSLVNAPGHLQVSI